jgi:phage terminase large subunit-like protein
VVSITTAGDPQGSPLWVKQRQRAEIALARPEADPRFLPIIYRADPAKIEADPNYWTTRAARVEANPSHEDNGGFLRDSAIVEQLADGESAYKRFHLNIPAQENDRLIPLEKWHACRAPLRPFTGRKFIAGFDLSAVRDFTALALLYPDADGTFDLKIYTYVPEAHVSQLERITHQPLREWVQQGHLIATPGDTVDYDYLHQQLSAARELAQAHHVGYDRRYADDLVKRLKKDRFLCEPIDQGYNGMTGAIQAFEKLVHEKRIRHEGNFCMDWMMACTTIKVSDDGGRKPDKSGERSTKADRIDGISATLTAIATLQKYPVRTESRGLVFA